MGRARTFDTEEALEKAMVVFWSRGYDGALLAELTAAMGIGRTSLYAAFGNKEQLFKLALDRYMEGPSGYVEAALAEPSARRVALALLHGAADLHTAPETPPGCMVVQGALACRQGSAAIRDTLATVRLASEESIRERLQRAVAEGDLPADADPGVLAAYLRTVTYGMAVRATSGATRDELERVIELTMRAWPGGSP